ncbi:MAG TPA: sigma-54 dependent transcriptional regulator [Terriglobales bacterium]|nr:sigma-54 dependent transcriptional regulator [Terriglobales bacterium]
MSSTISSGLAAQQARLPSGLSSAPIGILVLSANADLRCDILSRLHSGRWNALQAQSGASAIEVMERGNISLVLLDPALPDLRVEEFKEIVQAYYPAIEIVPINPGTGQPLSAPSPESICFEAVREIGRGGALKGASAAPENAGDDDAGENSLPGFVGTTPAVQNVCRMARLVARRDTTVLITGESGTGKDLVARAVHHLSPRGSKAFVVINCAAIPETLLEAELFGFVKGAFTGAVQSRIGRIHAAQGGTLFLDEIGDLPLGLQSKLLRFLEQGEVQRLGSSDTFRVDVRVLAATNSNLRQLVQSRGFREDLFYRLSVFPIELPPLRERMDDLLALAQNFLAKFCAGGLCLTAEAASLLRQHTWPGNVREVRNVMERACILAQSDGEIRPEHIVI